VGKRLRVVLTGDEEDSVGAAAMRAVSACSGVGGWMRKQSSARGAQPCSRREENGRGREKGGPEVGGAHFKPGARRWGRVGGVAPHGRRGPMVRVCVSRPDRHAAPQLAAAHVRRVQMIGEARSCRAAGVKEGRCGGLISSPVKRIKLI
jgi:hypothetical protein